MKLQLRTFTRLPAKIIPQGDHVFKIALSNGFPQSHDNLLRIVIGTAEVKRLAIAAKFNLNQFFSTFS